MTDKTSQFRWVIVAMVIATAFVGAYAFAQARGPQSAASPNALAVAGAAVPAQPAANGAPSGATGAGGSACACCGGGGQPTANGVSGNPVEGTAQATGGVQKISVDVSQGVYNPNVIKVKAGVPVEITFGQGSGCTGYVQSQDLNFQTDISQGPQTVKLPALQPGTYSFACGMNMVFGKVVVE